jgi:hypothetical protein
VAFICFEKDLTQIYKTIIIYLSRSFIVMRKNKLLVTILLLGLVVTSKAENDSLWHFDNIAIAIQNRVSPFVQLSETQLENLIDQPGLLDGYQMQTRYNPTENFRFYFSGSVKKNQHELKLGFGLGVSYPYSAFGFKDINVSSDTFINPSGNRTITDRNNRRSINYDFYTNHSSINLSYIYHYSQSEHFSLYTGAGTEWIHHSFSDNTINISESDVEVLRFGDSITTSSSVRSRSFKSSASNSFDFNHANEYRVFGLIGLESTPFKNSSKLRGLGVFGQFEASTIWSQNKYFYPGFDLFIQFGLGINYHF